jgi:DNA mismatch repair protein MLH1
MDRREMLSEYFSLNISDDGLVETLPLLLRNYTPNLDKLPLFIMRLGPQVNSSMPPWCRLYHSLQLSQVDWTSETECFESFLRELAYFYVPGPMDGTNLRTDEPQSEEEKAERWQIEHVLFPTIRKNLLAPKSLLERDVVQVASLPDLYRVFERC